MIERVLTHRSSVTIVDEYCMFVMQFRHRILIDVRHISSGEEKKINPSRIK